VRSIVNALTDGFRLVRDLGRFVWARKVWWMVPLLVVLLLVIALVVLGETPLAPFIYTLF
jgi:hypothetical protein